MIRTRRGALALLSLGLMASAALLPALPVRADTFPSKPVTIILPYAPGGGPDLLTRVFADKMSEHLGQRVIVDNRVGAAGMLAAQVAANATPDGYTLLLGASNHITQKLIQPGVKWDPVKDFVHIVRLGGAPTVMLVDAEAPYQTAKELIAAAKAKPGSLNYASGGIGSAAHLTGAAFATVSGIDVVHVPYRGSVEIVPSILSKTTQFGFPVASTALPLVNTGKVRALGVSSPQRLPQLPNVPTLKEILGSEDVVIESWSGLWAPAGTPREAVAKLNAAAQKTAQDKDVLLAFERGGSPMEISKTPEEFSRFVADDMAKQGRIVAAAKITAE